MVEFCELNCVSIGFGHFHHDCEIVKVRRLESRLILGFSSGVKFDMCSENSISYPKIQIYGTSFTCQMFSLDYFS